MPQFLLASVSHDVIHDIIDDKKAIGQVVSSSTFRLCVDTLTTPGVWRASGHGQLLSWYRIIKAQQLLKSTVPDATSERVLVPMDAWVILILFASLCFALTILVSSNKKKRRLPPGPPSLPIVGSVAILRKAFFDIVPTVRRLCSEYGPIVTVYIGPRPAIFISDRTLAHQALVQNGAVFADRRPSRQPQRILNSNQHSISTARYGPLWRLLRRNLASEILHPSRVKSFSHGRDWVLRILFAKLRAQAETGDRAVVVIESFHDAMFCLLVLMCFGEKLEEKAISKIEDVQRNLLLSFRKFVVFAFFPRITKHIFRKRWNELLAIRRKLEEIFIPLIRARRDRKQKQKPDDESFLYSYVDSLLGLQHPEEGRRKLTEGEMVSLCSEFLNGGTDTTATALQWIMANLVKRPDIQEKLAAEIKGAVGSDAEAIQEEDLHKMPYLKAVILEGLRRHPPTHFVLPHAVTEEITIGGYVIPKNASINFMVAEMNWDEKVWDDPMEFRPERFLAGGPAEGVDITGSREIKMMPFGVGRRICPGLGLAMLHLEYFVANLVREFEWKAVDGEEVDLSEKFEFTVVMKKPLRARILSRSQ